jgi:hypothetical protein
MAAANSTTANSATSGQASPPNGRHDSCHPSAGPTSDSAECIDAHLEAAIITSRAACSSTFFSARAYANTAAGSSHPSRGSGSVVEVIVGPTQPSTTDSRSPEILLSTAGACLADPPTARP